MHTYSNFVLKSSVERDRNTSKDEQIQLVIELAGCLPITKRQELGQVASKAVEAPSQQCSCLAGTQLHIERTMLPQLPAAL